MHVIANEISTLSVNAAACVVLWPTARVVTPHVQPHLSTGIYNGINTVT